MAEQKRDNLEYLFGPDPGAPKPKEKTEPVHRLRTAVEIAVERTFEKDFFQDISEQGCHQPDQTVQLKTVYDPVTQMHAVTEAVHGHDQI